MVSRRRFLNYAALVPTANLGFADFLAANTPIPLKILIPPMMIAEDFMLNLNITTRALHEVREDDLPADVMIWGERAAKKYAKKYAERLNYDVLIAKEEYFFKGKDPYFLPIGRYQIGLAFDKRKFKKFPNYNLLFTKEYSACWLDDAQIMGQLAQCVDNASYNPVDFRFHNQPPETADIVVGWHDELARFTARFTNYAMVIPDQNFSERVGFTLIKRDLKYKKNRETLDFCKIFLSEANISQITSKLKLKKPSH